MSSSANNKKSSVISYQSSDRKQKKSDDRRLTTDSSFLKIGAAAKALGVSIDTLRRWEKAGKISAIRTPGGTRLYPISTLKKANPSASWRIEENQARNLNTEELLKKTASEDMFPSVIARSDVTSDRGNLNSDLVEIAQSQTSLNDNLINSLFSKFLSTKLLIGSAIISVITILLTGWISASYLTQPEETQQFFKNNVASAALSPFHKLAEATVAVIDPQKAQELGFSPKDDQSLADIPPAGAPPGELAQNVNSKENVLAVTSASRFLEVNTDTQINGSLFVRDQINNLSLEGTPSASTIIATSGDTTLTVTNDSTIDQNLARASSPTFSTLNLSATSNQLVFQSGGPTGTLTWTPTAARIITLPDATTTLVGTDTTQTLTNKSLSGSSNTFTSIPNSALVNKKVTVSAGTNLSGGGDVELGSSVSLSLKESPEISGVLLLANGTAAAPSLSFSSDTDTGLYRIGANNIALITAGTATSGLSIDANGNVGIATITPTSKLHVVGTANVTSNTTIGGTLGVTGATTLSSTLGVSGATTLSSTLNVSGNSTFGTNSLFIDTSAGNVGIGTTSPLAPLQVWGNGTNSAFFLNGNVGIGNTIPAYTLDITGTARITSSLTIDKNNGALIFTGTTPSITTTNGSLGIFSSTGNVGIGVSNPGATLSVAGNGSIGIGFSGSSAPANGLSIQGNLGVGASTANARLFVNGGATIGSGFNAVAPTNGLAIQGNVGIGTTSPTTALYVHGRTTVTNNILVENGYSVDLASSTQRIATGYFDTVDATNLAGTVTGGSTTSASWTINSDNATADTEDMALTFERGTSSPNASLGWNSNTSANPGYFTLNSGLLMTGTITGTNGLSLGSFTNDLITPTGEHLSIIPGTGGNVGIGNTSPQALFQINYSNSNPFVVTSGGNVGIGTTSPDRRLQTASDINITSSNASLLGAAGTQFSLTGNSSTGLSKKLVFGIDTTDNYGVIQAGNTSGSNYDLSLNPAGGNVGIGTTSPLTKLQVWGDNINSAFFLNGNVGIGTTTPITQLQVAGSVPSAAIGSVAVSGVGIYVQGKYAYAGSGAGLKIIDVSNPSAPAVVGTGGSDQAVRYVHVQGQYAYTTDNGTGNLRIFDVSNPASPVLKSTLATGVNAREVYVQGRYAYMVGGSNNIFKVYDVSNPTSPYEVGSLAAPTSVQTEGLTVNGRYAYIGTQDTNIWIVDISNPAIPVTAKLFTTTLSTNDVFVQGRYAYVVLLSGGLEIVDISNPTAPVSMSSINTTSARGVYVQGRYAYLAGNGLLTTIDVSNPSAPAVVGTVTTPTPWGVFVQGRYAYASSTGGNFSIYDLGGAYIQQLETGGIETGTLSVINNFTVNNDADIRGGLSLGSGGLFSTGSIGIGVTSSQPALLITQIGTGPAALFNGGNVGIGTSANSATNKLSVFGGVGIGNSGSGGFSNASAPAFGLAVQGNVGIGVTTANSTLSVSGNAHIGGLYQGISAPANGLFVDGNVGIGATTSSNKLDVWGNARITGNLTTDGTFTTGAISAPNLTLSGNNSALSFTGTTPSITSGANSFSIFSGGNVGIGISSPLYGALTVQGKGTGTGIALQTLGSGSTLTQGLTVLDNGNVGIGTTAPLGPLHVGSSTTNPSFWINSSGNIGIGTSGGNGGAALDSRVIISSLNAGNVDSSLALVNRDPDGTTGSGTGIVFYLSPNFGSTQTLSQINAQYIGGSSSVLTFSTRNGGSTAEKVRIDNAGNVGIGLTTANSKLSISNNVHIGSLYQGISAPANGLFVDGNVGIGATTSSNKLDVWGNARITGTLGVDSTGTLGAGLVGYSGVTAPSSGLAVSGNVGVGTTSPLQALHVVGQCVTGDTKLKRRRRRKGKNGGWEDYFEEVEIKDIKAGDEILTLDEHTGKFVVSKVNTLKNMGKQEVFELLTESGKSIQTTKNHPYFVDFTDQKVNLNLIQKDTFEYSEKLAKEFYINHLAGRKIKSKVLADTVLFTHTGWNHFVEKSRSLNELIVRFFALPRLPLVLKHSQGVTGYRKTVKEDITIEYWELQAIVEHVQVKVLVSAINGGQKFFLSCNWLGTKEETGIKTNKKELSLSPRELNSHSDRRRELVIPQLFNKLTIPENKEDVKWVKVQDLAVGQKIATTAGWERIVSIKSKGKKQTFDIEVENTHNFVGNNIVAHNTYINSGLNIGASFTASGITVPTNGLAVSGNVGIGTTTANSNLSVSGSAHIGSLRQGIAAPTDGLFVDGNVGIGATTSSNKLDVWGNARITGTLSVDQTASFGGNFSLTSGQFLAPNGTASLPSYSFTNSTSTGLYSPSANALALNTNGASTPPLTITAGGNVGIGTTIPGSLFTVGANAMQVNSTGSISLQNNAGIALQGGNAVANTILASGIGTNTTNGNFAIYANGSTGTISIGDTNSLGSGAAGSGLINITRGTTNIVDILKSGGNVGIGTSAPNTVFDVSAATTGATGYSARITDTNSTTGATFLLGFNNAGTITYGALITDSNGLNLGYAPNGLGSGPTNIMSLNNSSGNVGIGIGAPLARLDIFHATNPTLKLTNNAASNQLLIGTYSNNIAEFRAHNGATGSILSLDLANKRVGIGTSGPSYKLDVLDSTANGRGINIAQSATSGTVYGLYSNVTGASTTNVGGYFSATGATTNYGLVVPNGGGLVGIGTVTPISLLDVAGGTGSMSLSLTSANTNANTRNWAIGLLGSQFGTLEFSVGSTQGGAPATASPKIVFDLNGNVGIGTATPGSLLGVNGSVAIGSYATGAAPANGLVVSGNVGIGISAPDRIAHVASTIDLTSSTLSLMGVGGTQFGISGATTNAAKKLVLGIDTTDNYGVIQAGNTDGTNYNLALNPAGGNIGIGTTNPVQLFQVNYSSSNPVVITSGGNVGIGVTTPAYKLDVSGITNTRDFITQDLTLNSLSTSTITSYRGFDGYTSLSGGLGTAGNQRLTATGNLVNIGSIQAGETLLTSSGTFAAKVDYTTGTTPNFVAIGDLNGDGRPDLAVANRGATTVSVFINNGNGTFAAKVDYTTGGNADSVAIGDVNGDGKADLAVGTLSSSVSVLINNGNGTFATKVDYSTNTTVSYHHIVMGDMNGDGKPDIASVNYDSNTISVLLNNGDGTFATKVTYAGGSNPYFIAVGDVNGDGKQDLVTANTAGTVSVYINNGNGTFVAKADYSTTSNSHSVAIGDVNGDGKADLAATNYNAAVVSVLLNNGDGTFPARTDYTTGAAAIFVTMGDINGDGKPDLAVANNSVVSIFMNKGDGSFLSKVDYTPNAGSLGIALGDLNGDGKLDMAVTAGGTNLSVFMNNKVSMFYANAASGNIGIGTSANLTTNKFSVFGSVGIGNSGPTGFSNTAAPSFGLIVEGNVGIGFSSPGGRLDVYHNTSSSDVNILRVLSDVGGTNTVKFRVDSDGDVFSDGGTAMGTPADVAENYPVLDESIEAGDVVTTSDQVSELKNKYGEIQPYIQKSDSSYQKNILGIISTKPGVLLSANTEGKAVALSGRIPLKVSTENGSIKVGDYLTSSSIPGVAMKATRPGQVVGKALEAFSCQSSAISQTETQSDDRRLTTDDCSGKILTFVNVSFADPGNFLSSLSMDDEGNLIAPKIKTGKLSIDPSVATASSQLTIDNGQLTLASDPAYTETAPSLATNSNTFDLSGKIATLEDSLKSQESRVKSLEEKLAELTSSKYRVASIMGEGTNSATPSANTSATLSASLAESSSSANPDLIGTNLLAELNLLDLTDPSILLASDSASLTASLDTYSDATFSGVLTAYQAQVQDSLKVYGNTTLSNTNVAGDLNVDGTLSIETGNTINVIGTLYLQNSLLAEKLDIFNGKVTIDKSGKLTVQSVSAKEYLGVSGTTVGSGKILAGNKSVEISSTLVKSTSRILITPTTETSLTLAVTSKVEGQKFIVSVFTPPAEDITFDWFVINETN